MLDLTGADIDKYRVVEDAYWLELGDPPLDSDVDVNEVKES